MVIRNHLLRGFLWRCTKWLAQISYILNQTRRWTVWNLVYSHVDASGIFELEDSPRWNWDFWTRRALPESLVFVDLDIVMDKTVGRHEVWKVRKIRVIRNWVEFSRGGEWKKKLCVISDCAPSLPVSTSLRFSTFWASSPFLLSFFLPELFQMVFLNWSSFSLSFLTMDKFRFPTEKAIKWITWKKLNHKTREWRGGLTVSDSIWGHCLSPWACSSLNGYSRRCCRRIFEKCRVARWSILVTRWTIIHLINLVKAYRVHFRGRIVRVWGYVSRIASRTRSFFQYIHSRFFNCLHAFHLEIYPIEEYQRTEEKWREWCTHLDEIDVKRVKKNAALGRFPGGENHCT